MQLTLIYFVSTNEMIEKSAKNSAENMKNQTR